jgi:hypothetical protein
MSRPRRNAKLQRTHLEIKRVFMDYEHSVSVSTKTDEEPRKNSFVFVSRRPVLSVI